MIILSIETSCDETCAAVTLGRRVLSNVIFSQINLHRKYGGVYPFLAKREHEKKIDLVIEKALLNADVDIRKIDAIGVTFGPGLVIALEVGIKKAKELAFEYRLPLIPVNHLEGHLYSGFAQNRQGIPIRNIAFPIIGLIVSGGHTSLILIKDYLDYQILGQTLDDALGESLDKAAKMLGLGYPGGPIIEKLAEKGNPDFFKLPIPLIGEQTFNFSYSGLKTAFKYQLQKMSAKEKISHLPDLAASFQQAAFNQVVDRLAKVWSKKGPTTLCVGGGVIVNKKLRQMIRQLAKKNKITVYFPSSKKLIGDNAAMVGVAAHFKYQKGIWLRNHFERLDRVGRPDLKMWNK